MIYFGDFSAAAAASSSYWYAESLADTGALTGGPTTALSLTIPAADQTANAKYMMLWSVLMKPNSGFSSVTPRIDGTSGVEQNEQPYSSGGNSHYPAFGGVRPFTAAATPADIILDIRRTGSHNLAGARICAIPIGASALIASNTSQATATGTSYTDGLTLALTAGDWVVFVAYTQKWSNATISCRSQVVINSTLKCGSVRLGRYTRQPVFFAFPLTVASSDTVKIQHQVEFAGSYQSQLDEQFIIAVPASEFAFVQSQFKTSRTNTSSTSFVSQQTQTFTPTAGPALIVSGATQYNTGNANYQGMRFTDGGTVKQETVFVPPANYDHAWCHPFGEIRTVAASSLTQTQEVKTSANNTALEVGSSILTLGLN